MNGGKNDFVFEKRIHNALRYKNKQLNFNVNFEIRCLPDKRTNICAYSQHHQLDSIKRTTIRLSLNGFFP